MIYPAHFEQKTGFDRIREEIRSACLGDAGRRCCAMMQFHSEATVIRRLLGATAEFGAIMDSGRNFPSQDYFDLREELKRLTITGMVIEQEAMADLRASLRTLAAILDYFNKDSSDVYPLLREMVGPAYLDPEILRRTDRILDEKGDIRDNASETLADIRKQLDQKKGLVEKRIRQVYLGLKKEGYTPDEAEITIRNGRSVIPLPAANKRIIKGFIHDESATGQTVYIEPEEIFELNNNLRELEAAERREIRKILAAFSDFLRPEIEQLIPCYEVLGEVDFTRAKALCARKLNALVPRVIDEACMDLKNAVNPILFLAGMQSGKKVVPLNIRLSAEERILVISGPNAGGKSVCLKTAGLLQYMLQCGMPIPVSEESEAGIFESLYIEIGDEQSIENDLSTYSSHLRNIKVLTESAKKGLLFLVDEFGSGTEPQLGGAIAEAVLEHLVKSGAHGIVSTHYLNLKLMAGKVEGIVNGAMLYDTNNMRPLYSLVIGKPGSSFAFEIAAKTGFSKEILNSATVKTGMAVFDFEQQLQQLETERVAMDVRKREFDIADELLASLIERYSALTEKVEASRKQILEQAKTDAAELLQKSNQKIEEAIRKIRESQAKKEVNIEVREELKEFAEHEITPFVEQKTAHKPHVPAIKRKEKTVASPKAPAVPMTVREGGFAMLIGQHTVFEVEKIEGKYATVSRDNIRLKIPVSQLEGCKNDRDARRIMAGKRMQQQLSSDVNEKLSKFKTTIDVRGQRAEETLSLIQKYIDDAILLNVFEVRILHGKGNGILRKLIREYLSSVKEVKSFTDESLESGGHGITIVSFR